MLRKILALSLVCLTVLLGVCAYAADNRSLPVQLAWTMEPWDGNEKPFQQIRSQIDKAIAGGASPDALLKQYRTSAQRDYYNAQAQYRYGYSAVAAAIALQKDNKNQERIRGVVQALNAPASPRTAEYARLRYLALLFSWYYDLTTEATSAPSYYNDLGKRLLARNPKDYYVIYHLTQQLLYNSNPQYDRRVLALNYAQRYYKAQPQQPKANWLLGEVYANLAYEHRSDAYAKKALIYENRSKCPAACGGDG